MDREMGIIMENRIFLDSYLSNLDTWLILNDNSMGENYQRKRILVQKVFEKVKNETQNWFLKWPDKTECKSLGWEAEFAPSFLKAYFPKI